MNSAQTFKKYAQVQQHPLQTHHLTKTPKLQNNKENINIQAIQTEHDESPIPKDYNNQSIKSARNLGNKYTINLQKVTGHTKISSGSISSKGWQKVQKQEVNDQSTREQKIDINRNQNNGKNQEQVFPLQYQTSYKQQQLSASSRGNVEDQQEEKYLQQTNNGSIKFYNSSTTSYQKILTSRSQRQLGVESSSLGSSEMRRILRSSFQKQSDLNQTSFKYSCQDFKNNLNISESQINGCSSSIKHSLNFTHELGDSTSSSNRIGAFDQEQASHMTFHSHVLLMQSDSIPSNHFISTQPSPDRDEIDTSSFKQSQTEQEQEQILNQSKTRNTNHLAIQINKKNAPIQSIESKFQELDTDLAITELLNVEEHNDLEDSTDNRNFPSSPLIPIKFSRIYKNDARKATQTSHDFSMSVQQTHIFYDINALDFFNDNQFALRKIVSYLDIKSCLNFCSSHNFFRSKKQRRHFNKQLKWLMIKGLLPKTLRANYWVHVSRAFDFKKSFTPENYRVLSLCEPRCEREIIQDIDRTFPNIKEFRTKEKTFKLHKVLRALSFCLPDMEYCQGLNYVVGSLLLYAEEEESFYICVSMLKNYGFKDCYFEDLNGLQLAVKILDNLIKLHFPHVADFLNKKNIQTGLFCTSWFNTLFSYDFPRSFFIRVIDLFLFSGWKVLFQISLAIVQEAQHYIFSADEDDIVNIIKKGLYFNEEQILLNSQTFKITNTMVVDLSKILTKNPFIRNLNLSYDIKARKRRWEYEIDTSNSGDEYIIRQATLQRQKNNFLKKQQKDKQSKGFFSDIIDAITPSFCCSSDVNNQDYEQEINMKKRDFRNFSTFSSSNLNGSRHFLLPLEDKQSILEQWHGAKHYEPDVNFDNQMIEQQNKTDLTLRNSVKSHPKKFIETIKKSFVDL